MATVLVVMLSGCVVPERPEPTTTQAEPAYCHEVDDNLTRSEVAAKARSYQRIKDGEILGDAERLAGPQVVLINDAEAWAFAWDLCGLETREDVREPAIDFESKFVILVLSGVKGSGGHSLSINGFAAEDGTLHVNWIETKPGEGCGVHAAINVVFDVVQVPRQGDVAPRTAVGDVSERTQDCA